MRLRVLVTTKGPMPKKGARVHVEVRDASVADARAVIVAAGTAPIDQEPQGGAKGSSAPGRAPLADVTLELPDDGNPADWTIWAHVPTTEAPGLAVGDWITVQSYPVPSATGDESVTGPAVPYAEVEVVQI